MTKQKRRKSKRNEPERVPKTKIRFKALMKGHKMQALAAQMGVTYTQLYYYRNAGANPTLLALEDLAAALTKLKKRRVTIFDIIGKPRLKS